MVHNPIMESNTHAHTLIEHIAAKVEYYKERFGLNTGKAFLLWYGIEALDLDENEALVAVSYDGGNDNGLDFFYVDDESQTVIIAQGKFQQNGTYNARVGAFLELVHSTDKFKNIEILKQDGRDDLVDIAMDFNEALSKGYGAEYQFVYMGPPKKEVVDAANLFNGDEDFPGRSASIVDLTLLQQIHDEYIDAASRIPEAELEIDPNTIFRQSGPYGDSLVATVSGTELKRLYQEHRDTLFDRNVRLFLGTRKGSVNAGIRDTLNSSEDRGNFWAYNNGITLICDSFELGADNTQVKLRKFSIVNGCQTTVSIANSSDEASASVGVLARFIAQSDPQVVDSIIRYNNSQTKIRDWDLTSQDRNHKRLKNRLAEVPHPFFYQLRKGEWTHLGTEEKSRFTRRNRPHIIEPDLLAQRLAAFKGMPVTAYKDKAALFSTHSRVLFPPDLQVQEVLLAWQAGEAVDDVIANAVVAANQRDDKQEMRVLTRGGRMFVLAVTAILLELRNGSTVVARLDLDRAGSFGSREILDKYATVALSYYLDIMDERIEAGGDINQMVRSEDSFARIQQRVRRKYQRDSLSEGFVNSLPTLIS